MIYWRLVLVGFCIVAILIKCNCSSVKDETGKAQNSKAKTGKSGIKPEEDPFILRSSNFVDSRSSKSHSDGTRTVTSDSEIGKDIFVNRISNFVDGELPDFQGDQCKCGFRVEANYDPRRAHFVETEGSRVTHRLTAGQFVEE